MTTTVPQHQHTQGFRPSLPSVQSTVIAAGVLGSALLLWGIAASQGSAKSALFGLGLALGVTLFHSRFGFTSAWRQLISVGQGRALQAHTVMLGLAVVLFGIVFEIGSGWFGTTPDGFYAPITLALFVGATLFGIGMQLGGSCASGTLFATGSGYKIDATRRSVIFVGRITRQKGLSYFLQAAEQLPDDVQLILAAGAPDTPEIKAEVEGLVAKLKETRSKVIWIPEHLPQKELAALLTASDLFVCPSIYEPLGIVNLEAMACGAAVIGTATGGIPEVVVQGQTGWLVEIDQMKDGTGTPKDPARFVQDWADTMNQALDSGRLEEFGRAGRLRAKQEFSWESIATRTLEVYQSALGS